MGEIIALVILLGSLGGIALILLRKIPTLLKLSADQDSEATLGGTVGKWKDKWTSSGRLQHLSSEAILQKVLLKTRIFALKLEQTSTNLLERLRKRSQEKKNQFSPDYWQQFKKGRRRKGKNNTPR